jgi:hypothetical protein
LTRAKIKVRVYANAIYCTMVSVDTFVLRARDERDIPKAGRWFRPNQATKHGDFPGMFVAGATGLEPATSGVTRDRKILDALLEVVPQPA